MTKQHTPRHVLQHFHQPTTRDLPEFHLRTNASVNIDLTFEIVRKEILLINRNKAFGPDEIHPRMLKILVEFTTEPLFIVMTKSLSEGNLPKD